MDPTLDQARQRFLEGVEHFEASRFEAARAAFEAALALAPGRPSVLGNLGITLYHLRQFQDALPLLRQATAADPAYVEAWACLGLTLEALGQLEAAAEIYETAATLSPTIALPWLRKATCLTRLGKMQDALQAFDRALEISPQDAEAWTAKGSVLRELHRFDDAALCFEKALACGGDAELNHYYLASVRNTAVPPTPPRRYVEGLFDDYASEFQQHVTRHLRYQGYAQLLQPLADAQQRFTRAIDLGCGTGLCAPLLHSIANVVDGVDLSQAMLEEARKLGLYRELVHADIATYLASTQESADLIVAADVFIYVGDLHQIFASVRRMLVPGGLFAFTLEEASDEQELQLRPSLRYAHSINYLKRLAVEHGFVIERLTRAPIRHDQGQPVEGLYVYLR